MRKTMAIVVVAIGTGVLPGGRVSASEPEPKVALNEAVTLMRDETAMKEPANRQKVQDCFKTLTDGEKQQLLAELLPLLTNPPAGWYSAEESYAAFVAVGTAALTPLVDALADDKRAPAAMSILLRFQATNVIAALAPALGHAELKVKVRALSVLADDRVARSLPVPPPVLLEMIKDTNAVIRRETLRTLVAYGPKAKGGREALIQFAGQSPDISERVLAVRLLGSFGTNGAPAVNTLTTLVCHPSLSLRAEALEAMGKLGATAASAVDVVNERLLDAKEDTYIRRRAPEALVRLGQPGLAALSKALKHSDLAVRCYAIEALGRLGGDPAVDLCVAALKDPSPAVARAAAVAVATLVTNAVKADALLAGYRAAVAGRPSQEPEKKLGPPAADLEKYEIGGPLAGLRLPSYATQHGEPPGYPGCIPALAENGKSIEDMGHVYKEYDAQGQPPELQLYPGAVEHWRSYMFKYLPVRSLFDAQSQLKNWTAPDIPHTGGTAEPYAEPVYWVPRHAAVVNTGYTNKPAPVFRCKPGAPVFQLDLGTLDVGLYAVRVIGAVPTAQLKTFREPLYLDARISDGPGGALSLYRVRLGYVDEFYSIAEIYFHAVEKRDYRAELTVGAGSRVDLLVHNISLDDALAGQQRQALKTRRTLAGPPPVPKTSGLAPQARLDRDATLWESFPPINHQGGLRGLAVSGDDHTFRSNVSEGAAGQSLVEIADQFGAWVRPGTYMQYNDPKLRDVFLVNEKLNLKYTLDELKAYRPLPDPFPYKDDGAGLYFPDPQDEGKGRVWAPIAEAVQARIGDYYYMFAGENMNVDRWQKNGDADAARDAAIALARYAYAFPAIDFANFLIAVIRDPGPYRRDYRCRRRETLAAYMPHYMMYVDPIMYKYDALFDYIKDNQDLADSIGRYVPWIKTPRDVIMLIDTYFVQTVAKRILRYHYATNPMDIANLAAVVGNTHATDPWMDWLFSRGFVYPLPLSGIQDLMITGSERDGCQYIGSTFYAQEKGGLSVGVGMEKYMVFGGNPKYNLTDPARYPKPIAQCYWRIANVVAGGDFLRIGDVCGPDKAPGGTLRDLRFARYGWKWTRDPKFAFIVNNYLQRETETEQEWAAIVNAAAQVKRAPWLDNRSRVMPMWAGVLEGGLDSDDYRFRRAAYVRTGFGIGHAHLDAMDLQVFAHGLPVTIDGGQRPGYSRPIDTATRIHNVVQVDGTNFDGYSWTRALADAPGAPYLQVEAEPPEGATLFRRQVALIDTDPGQGSQPAALGDQFPWCARPKNVVLPNAYVFDVFRVSGGQTHTYCFHGPVDDEFQWNASGVGPVSGANSPAGQWLMDFRFPEKKLAGRAPEVLEATWRQTRAEGNWNEASMLSKSYDAAQPRHYTRLHLMGAEGALAMRANVDCYERKYNFSCLFAQRGTDQPGLESAFAAIVEPYRGTPFIAGLKTLAVADNESDALRAVALEVKTVNGNTDLCFADGRPEKKRSVQCSKFGVQVSGEFGYYSIDNEGLRQATLAGGTLLETPAVTLRADARERTGKVVKVDYLKRVLWIDQRWPDTGQPLVFEVGVPGHWTTYTAVKAEAEGNLTKLTVDKGADYYRSRIEDIDTKQGTVRCALSITMTQRAGIDKHWVASDDEMKRFWRADYIDEKTFKLSPITGAEAGAAPVAAEAFGSAQALRLWEYGVGDGVRHSTFASVRRVTPPAAEPGKAADPRRAYEVAADVDVRVGIAGGAARKITAEELDKNHGLVTIREK